MNDQDAYGNRLSSTEQILTKPDATASTGEDRTSYNYCHYCHGYGIANSGFECVVE